MLINFINVYASYLYTNRRSLWADLVVKKRSLVMVEWCIVGDFNIVL